MDSNEWYLSEPCRRIREKKSGLLEVIDDERRRIAELDSDALDDTSGELSDVEAEQYMKHTTRLKELQDAMELLRLEGDEFLVYILRRKPFSPSILPGAVTMRGGRNPPAYLLKINSVGQLLFYRVDGDFGKDLRMGSRSRLLSGERKIRHANQHLPDPENVTHVESKSDSDSVPAASSQSSESSEESEHDVSSDDESHGTPHKGNIGVGELGSPFSTTITVDPTELNLESNNKKREMDGDTPIIGSLPKDISPVKAKSFLASFYTPSEDSSNHEWSKEEVLPRSSSRKQHNEEGNEVKFKLRAYYAPDQLISVRAGPVSPPPDRIQSIVMNVRHESGAGGPGSPLSIEVLAPPHDAAELVCIIGVHIHRHSKSRIDQVSRLIYYYRLSRTQYNSKNDQHERILFQLWNLIFPNVRLKNRISKQWIDVGFQGSDPATDFRDMGLLGLYCIHYFAKRYPETVRKLIRSGKIRDVKYSYPFAVAGLHTCHMLMGLVGICGLNESLVRLPPSDSMWNSTFLGFLSHISADYPDDAFVEVFCLSMEMLDSLWDQSRATNMDFGNVVKALKSILVQALSRRPPSERALRRLLQHSISNISAGSLSSVQATERRLGGGIE